MTTITVYFAACSGHDTTQKRRREFRCRTRATVPPASAASTKLVGGLLLLAPTRAARHWPPPAADGWKSREIDDSGSNPQDDEIVGKLRKKRLSNDYPTSPR